MPPMMDLLRRKAGLLAAAAILVAVFLWLTQSVRYCGWDYHNSLWGPVNMLVGGSTPYTLNPPYGPFPAVWMPHAMGFFFWFGLLPCTYTASLWTIAAVCGYIWLIWLFNDLRSPPRWIFVISLLAMFLYPPLWVHYVLGQFSMLFALLMIIIAFIPGAWRWAPLLLAVGLTKPQLGLLVYPGLVVHTWRHLGFRQAARLVALTVLCVAVMTIPLFIFYPGWISDFILVTVDNFNKHWNLPSMYVQLPALLGPAGTLIWGLVFLASLALTLWMWYRLDKKTAVIFTLALTPMVTTYTSSWDFMLQFPAFFWLLHKLKARASRVVLLSGVLLVFVFQYAARWRTDISDGSQWWIPLAMNAVFLLTLLVERKRV